jgi:hypothetical protein
MAMWLVIDGTRVGEVHGFRVDEPPRQTTWGPIFVHMRTPPMDTCTFEIKGAPPSQQGIWVMIVDDDGAPLHEITILTVDTRMGLGSATSTVKARLL